ncbi:MAG: HAMP domain-containing protein [Gammaproteobacteria bacterium]|nr:HAMP domain-containing protein [Gammaproteobacteria bacterium]MCP5136245.1 HAMP domain-containing protein [Gammaproteobacteria bacterium]
MAPGSRFKFVNRIPGWVWPSGGVLMLLVSFYLLGQATENSADFGRLYSWLLILNVLGLIVLVIMVSYNLITLLRQYRSRIPGSRLNVRLLVIFIVLAVAPVVVVFSYSVQFINRGIDSWFDVRLDTALNDALALSQAALDQRMRKNLDDMRAAAMEIRDVPDRLAALAITDLRVNSGAEELTLFGRNGHIIASSGANPADIVPDHPSEEVLSHVRGGEPYVGMEPDLDGRLVVRVVVTGVGLTDESEERIMQGLYPMRERIGHLTANVQEVFGAYDRIVYLRTPLKNTFTFTLSMVLLLSLAFAVWSAFFFARRLTSPIRDLAEGTRAVAAGDYSTQLPAPGKDDIGSLVRSFNAMTRRLAKAREAEQASQEAIEKQRAYLATVLGSLSSGVLTVDEDGVVRTMNHSAGMILGLDPGECAGRRPAEIASRHEHLQGFIDAIAEQIRDHIGDWHSEVTVFGPEGRRVLMCRGTALPDELAHDDAYRGNDQVRRGHVIVFDDVTALIQAQRDAAWGEVARRLAHEIKNPLTPIQLAAERLQRRLSKTLENEDAQVLSRGTTTIVQQVEAMKEMVNAFSDYAKPPQISRKPLDLNDLAKQVMELYRGPGYPVQKLIDLDPGLPPVEADAGRLRQVLHNLIKNAIEALQNTERPSLLLRTRCIAYKGTRFVELLVSDNGPGFPEEIKGRVFEPYVTNKTKGTGLGLAIVKKIIEEHGGTIRAENAPESGVVISIRLPAAAMRDGERCTNINADLDDSYSEALRDAAQEIDDDTSLVDPQSKESRP